MASTAAKRRQKKRKRREADQAINEKIVTSTLPTPELAAALDLPERRVTNVRIKQLWCDGRDEEQIAQVVGEPVGHVVNVLKRVHDFGIWYERRRK